MSRAVIGLYEFGPFRVDLERRVFTREQQVLPLPPKTFDLLVLLVQSPRRAFSKQELMSSLWPDTFVEEANLSFQISVLRKALGEDGARWVETVPKHGYRFSAEVRAIVRRAVVGKAAQRERTFLGAPEAQHQEGVAGGRDGHGGLARGRCISRRRCVSRARRGQKFACPRCSAHCVSGIRAGAEPLARRKSGRLFLERPDAGQLRHLRQIDRSRGTRALDDEPRARRLACVVSGWPFHRIRSLRVARQRCEPGCDPGAWRRRKDHCDDLPGAHSPPGRAIGNLSWTPDGRWLAFGGATSPNGSRGIWLVAVDGSEQRRLTEPPGGHDMSPVLSPDGRYLAFLRARTVGRVAIFLVPLTSGLAPGGTPRQLTDDDPGVSDSPGPGTGTISCSRPAGISVFHKRRRSQRPRNRVEPLNLNSSPSASRPPRSASPGRAGSCIRHSSETRLSTSLRFQGHRPAPVALANFSSTFDEQTPHYSPDGQQLAFASTRSGAEEIWIANKDGSNPLQVTSMGGPQCSNPQWSPDGRTILFNSRRAGSSDLYLLQPDTGKLTRLTEDPADEGEARWSRDGRSIYFGSDRTGRDEVWRMPAAGGAPAQITRQGGTAAIESGDGFLYYAKRSASPSSIWQVPVDGGAEVAVSSMA